MGVSKDTLLELTSYVYLTTVEVRIDTDEEGCISLTTGLTTHPATPLHLASTVTAMATTRLHKIVESLKVLTDNKEFNGDFILMGTLQYVESYITSLNPKALK